MDLRGNRGARQSKQEGGGVILNPHIPALFTNDGTLPHSHIHTCPLFTHPHSLPLPHLVMPEEVLAYRVRVVRRVGGDNGVAPWARIASQTLVVQHLKGGGVHYLPQKNVPSLAVPYHAHIKMWEVRPYRCDICLGAHKILTPAHMPPRCPPPLLPP